jgi:hypothetical protein
MDTAIGTPAADIRDMYAIHTLFRREFGLTPGLIRDVDDGDTERSGVLYEHIDLILRLLELYDEEHNDCPRFRAPSPGRGGIAPVVLLDGRHTGLHAVLDEISVLLPAWRATAAVAQAASLAAALERLAAVLDAHMTWEEEKVLWPHSASLAL